MNGTTERDTSERQSLLAASGLHPKHSAPPSLYHGGAHLSKLPICSADSYIQANHQGLRGKSFQETAHYIRRWLSDISQVQLAATQIFAPWVPPRGLVRASLNPKTCKPKTGLDILTARQRFYLLFLLFYYYFFNYFLNGQSLWCVWLTLASHILLFLLWSHGVSDVECPRIICPSSFLRVSPLWSHCRLLLLAQRNPAAFVLHCECAATFPALSVLRYFMVLDWRWSMTADLGSSNSNIPWISVLKWL